MRLNELHSSEFDIDKFESDCAKWLDVLRDAPQVAYHGAQTHVGHWTIMPMKHRTGPRDSPDEQHRKTNEFFKSKFGHECRNWMFVTGSSNMARGYGELFTIFPIGDFQYLWSPQIEDFANKTEEFRTEIRMQDRQLPYDMVKSEAQAKMDAFIREPGVWNFNTRIGAALKSGHEIMLDCKSFYMFEARGSLYWDKVRPWLHSKGIGA